MCTLCIIDFGDKIGMHIGTDSHGHGNVFTNRFFGYPCSKIALHMVIRNQYVLLNEMDLSLFLYAYKIYHDIMCCLLAAKFLAKIHSTMIPAFSITT